ncbi:unnamed protein product [Rotaria socialis]
MAISRDDTVETEVEDDTFEYAHGTVMIFAWMVFASTAILFARYGRAIRFGSKDKFLGEKNWFQIHRLLACLTSVTTLLGFFLILVQTNAEWVRVDEGQTFVHSVLGGIIVCCALWQAWMALFRCHPDGSYRFIFNWLHRLTGSLAFFLSIPAIFIIVEQLGPTSTRLPTTVSSSGLMGLSKSAMLNCRCTVLLLLSQSTIIYTTYGDIHLRLFPEYAPKACENFIQHPKQSYYNGCIFHRVMLD